jgi:hypothetical protein
MAPAVNTLTLDMDILSAPNTLGVCGREVLETTSRPVRLIRGRSG